MTHLLHSPNRISWQVHGQPGHLRLRLTCRQMNVRNVSGLKDQPGTKSIFVQPFWYPPVGGWDCGCGASAGRSTKCSVWPSSIPAHSKQVPIRPISWHKSAWTLHDSTLNQSVWSTTVNSLPTVVRQDVPILQDPAVVNEPLTLHRYVRP